MSKKFDDFKKALAQLCIDHNVELTVSINEQLAVFDYDGCDLTAIELMEDHTE